MRITFGMFLDGADWSQQPASLGEIKLGPRQFLAWLESRLGLDGVPVSAPERINEYMRKILHAKPEWSRASFELDPWSTAKQMLAWRDELRENGWDGRSGASERLKTLALLEADSEPLSPGVPDRMLAILAELPKYEFAGTTLVVQEPFELLPYLWKQVVERLRERGMTIDAAPEPPPRRPARTLRLNGADEFVLARECSRFLAAGDNRRTAIICGGDSSILDGALHRNGIGRLDVAETSRWRESLQILPLWLETLWKPFNPQRFLELLLLPVSPVPAKLARELIKALQKEPGRGGRVWNKAWENARSSFAEDGKIASQDQASQKLDAVWTMLEKGSFDAEKEVSGKAIIGRCDFLIKQLAARIEKHPELALVIEHAQTLKKIVAGREAVKRMELARILDSIISTGTTGDRTGRELTDFAVFSGPGMIDRDFDTILWWDFVDSGAAGAANWTAAEIAVMPGYDRAALRKLENRSWHQALIHAKEHLVFFVPQAMDGEAVFPHPLLDELKIDDADVLTPEKLVASSGEWRLAGRTAKLESKTPVDPKVKTTIGANKIAPARRLSYSQLNSLISCPFQWFMNDYLELRMPPAMDVPTGPPMIGTLAHRVVEEIYRGKETLTVAAAVGAAKEKFDELLPSMAAELLLDGRNVERERVRNTLAEAVAVLVGEINARGLRVKGSEKELHGTFAGSDFIGYYDLGLEDAAGNKFVIDMKWSSRPSYEKDLKENKALQLATYSWLLDPKDLNVRCAYFLFPKKQFVFDPAITWNELWENAELSWAQRMDEIHAGKLARGTADEKQLETSPLALSLAAGCKFCNYAALCAMMED